MAQGMALEVDKLAARSFHHILQSAERLVHFAVDFLVGARSGSGLLDRELHSEKTALLSRCLDLFF